MKKNNNSFVDLVILEGENLFSSIGNLHKLSECVYPHTELGINLKLLMQTPGRPPVGAMLDGTLVHDSDEHFLFTEKVIGKKVKTAQAAI